MMGGGIRESAADRLVLSLPPSPSWSEALLPAAARGECLPHRLIAAAVVESGALPDASLPPRLSLSPFRFLFYWLQPRLVVESSCSSVLPAAVRYSTANASDVGGGLSVFLGTCGLLVPTASVAALNFQTPHVLIALMDRRAVLSGQN